jgi:hypothetical protein
MEAPKMSRICDTRHYTCHIRGTCTTHSPEALVPRGYVYVKYYICMTNRTPQSRTKRVSPTRGKISTL